MKLSGKRKGLGTRSPRVIYSNSDLLILDHLRENMALYFFVLAMLSGGVIIGAMVTGSLSAQQADDLAEYTLGFFQSLEGPEMPVSGRDIFLSSLSMNFKTLGIVFLLGFTVIGMPVVALVVLVRGLIIGFAVSFLMYLQGGMGVGLAMVSILPQNLFLLTALVFCSVNALSYSLNILAVRRGAARSASEPSVLVYLLRGFVGFVVAFLGILVESYAVPTLMRLFAPYL
ncbi:MAG: stage II sporulation protein M [Bacillota bacterium]